MMVMLVSEVKNYEKYLDDKEWVAELKRDGNRLEIHFDRRTGLKFYNRNGKLYTKDVPKEIINGLLLSLDEDDYCSDFIIDGELTYTDIRGRDHRTQAQCPDAEPVLWVWDIQKLNGEDLKKHTWTIRKTELKTLCDIYDWHYRTLNNIRYVPHYMQKREILEVAEKNEMEGIVLKNINGKYEEGRTKNQIKVKFTMSDEYIVVGYTLASETSVNVKGETIPNKRYPYFKALCLAQYDKDGNIKSKGMIGGGFKDNDLKEITELLDKKITEDNTKDFVINGSSNPEQYADLIDKDYGVPKNIVRWLNVNDWFVIEIKMSGKTEYGNPFQPRFLSLRKDKRIEECVENDNW